MAVPSTLSTPVLDRMVPTDATFYAWSPEGPVRVAVSATGHRAMVWAAAGQTVFTLGVPRTPVEPDALAAWYSARPTIALTVWQVTADRIEQAALPDGPLPGVPDIPEVQELLAHLRPAASLAVTEDVGGDDDVLPHVLTLPLGAAPTLALLPLTGEPPMAIRDRAANQCRIFAADGTTFVVAALPAPTALADPAALAAWCMAGPATVTAYRVDGEIAAADPALLVHTLLAVRAGELRLVSEDSAGVRWTEVAAAALDARVARAWAAAVPVAALAAYVATTGRAPAALLGSETPTTLYAPLVQTVPDLDCAVLALAADSRPVRVIEFDVVGRDGAVARHRYAPTGVRYQITLEGREPEGLLLSPDGTSVPLAPADLAAVAARGTLVADPIRPLAPRAAPPSHAIPGSCAITVAPDAEPSSLSGSVESTPPLAEPAATVRSTGDLVPGADEPPVDLNAPTGGETDRSGPACENVPMGDGPPVDGDAPFPADRDDVQRMSRQEPLPTTGPDRHDDEPIEAPEPAFAAGEAAVWTSPHESRINIGNWERRSLAGCYWVIELITAATNGDAELEALEILTEIRLFQQGLPMSRTDKTTLTNLLANELKARVDAVRVFPSKHGVYFARQLANGTVRLIGRRAEEVRDPEVRAKVAEAYGLDPARCFPDAFPKRRRATRRAESGLGQGRTQRLAPAWHRA